MDHKDKSPLITFTVGDKSFQSDVAALQYFTKNLNNELRMDFGFSLGDDWSKQPDKDLEHYRQRMCAYIENTYSNIVIAYSGGLTVRQWWTHSREGEPNKSRCYI